MSCELLFSADDRTGSLEIGGLVANRDLPVPVGPHARSDRCCVVDIATRHLSPREAQDRMQQVLGIEAATRAHKMDAGLRGNWAYEIEVLLHAGFKVAVVCAYPDAGRVCVDGVVYIHGLPVLDSVFGQDPLNAPVSSRPREVLEHCGVSGDVVVWDAADNAAMQAAVARARAEHRLLVGASGALGELAAQLLGSDRQQRIELPRPRWVVCGSLNPLSRAQIEALDGPVRLMEGARAAMAYSTHGDGTVLTTPVPSGAISPGEAEAKAQEIAEFVRGGWEWFRTLVIVGGDTVGAIVGEDTLEVLGEVAPGIPVSSFRQRLLVTKGGGIGSPDVLCRLLEESC